jgi:alpha-1,3/alpha-1,6-mannosyltransferase
MSVILHSDRPTVISLNRFEGKKNVALAIRAFQGSTKRQIDGRALRLVVAGKLTRRTRYCHAQTDNTRFSSAGGYDDKVPDNVETLASLRSLCDQLSLSHVTITSSQTTDATRAPEVDVLFLLNFSVAQRSYLLHSPNTLALLYTPRNEHFGIVPVEAMACGLPVLAANTGGPLETIVDFTQNDAGTGLLREPKPEIWSEALDDIISLSPDRRREIAEAGQARVSARFSLRTLGNDLDQACQEAMSLGRPGLEDNLLLIVGSMGLAVVMTFTVTFLYVNWPEGFEL